MLFKLNGNNWKIRETLVEDDDFGECHYDKNLIEINKTVCRQQKIRTLTHELTHAWMWEFGHCGKNYSTEDVCNIISASHTFINQILKQYFKTI